VNYIIIFIIDLLCTIWYCLPYFEVELWDDEHTVKRIHTIYWEPGRILYNYKFSELAPTVDTSTVSGGIEVTNGAAFWNMGDTIGNYSQYLRVMDRVTTGSYTHDCREYYRKSISLYLKM